MAKSTRKSINNLSLNSSNVSIAGILVAKSDVRLFSRPTSSTRPSTGGSGAISRNSYRRGTNDNGDHDPNAVDHQTQRGVITFTVRDTQRSFINCAIWGNDSFVEAYNMLFHVGDIVHVMRPTVTIRKSVEEFNPLCSSPYTLTINEGTNEIVAYRASDEEDPNEFRALIHTPIKATSAALQLADINNNCKNSVGSFVDLLVVVRSVRPVKSFSSQWNGERQMRNLTTIVVMDQSSSGVQFNIWNQAFGKRSQSWLEMSTILQLIDVRAAYSNFTKTFELSTHGRTLIIENPKTRESAALVKYTSSVSTADLPPGCGGSNDRYDVATIKTVMTIKQICDRMESELDDNEFTAVLYAVIDSFDLDGIGKIFTRKCTQCKRVMAITVELCQSEDCILLRSEWMNNTSLSDKYVDMYDISVGLSDHTGSLPKCRLEANVAEIMLGQSLDRFRALSVEQRGEIKWKWLMERCTVKIIVKRKTAVRAAMVCIVDCVVAKQSDVLRHIKMY